MFKPFSENNLKTEQFQNNHYN